MKSYKIINAEPLHYSEEARALLKTFSVVSDGPFLRSELLERLNDVEGVIVRLGHRVDQEFLDNAPNLKMVATATTGLNHIDLKATAQAGVEVLSLKGEIDFLSTITATAEHTWGLLLALVRNTTSAFDHILKGQWDRSQFVGRDLSGMTLGIIGYGRLGKIVAEYAKSFRMNIQFYDISTNKGGDVKYVSLEELLVTSDVISLHVSLDGGSTDLLGEAEFSLIKPGAYLVNTSRGEIVDEDSLLNALTSGRLAGAAVDVLCNEVGTAGVQGGKMVAYAKINDNLLITPHIGGATVDSMWKTEVFMAKKIRKFFLGS